MKFGIRLLILFNLFFYVCTSQERSKQSLLQNDYPVWYLNPPVEEGTVVGSGVSETEIEAMMHAVGNMTENIETKISSLKTDFKNEEQRSIKMITEHVFGNIHVTVLSKRFMDLYEDGKLESYYEFNVKAILENNLGHFEAKYAIEDSNNTSHANVSIERKNLSWNDFIGELKLGGISIQKELINNRYFVLLKYKVRK